MKEYEIREGDIVEIDYIAEFTKEHVNEGKALVIWKGHNNQPLVRKLSTKKTIWTCYEHIARVVGHIDIEDYMDKTLSSEPCDDCISRQYLIEKAVSLGKYFRGVKYVALTDILNAPSVTREVMQEERNGVGQHIDNIVEPKKIERNCKIAELEKAIKLKAESEE